MAFGNNYAERSRKTDLITQIKMSRCPVVGRTAAEASVQDYRRKTVAELEAFAKAAYEEWQEWKAEMEEIDRTDFGFTV